MEKVKLNRHFISDIFFYQEGPGVRKWQFKDSGVKLINVGNINNGKIDLSSTKINISEEEAYGKYSHFLIDEGDLLIACSGIVVENFHNKIAFIKKEHLPLCLNTSTMRFKELPEKKGDLNFLKYFLQTNDFKSQLRKLITGSAQLNFGPSHIRKIEIPLPNLATQQRIAAILDQANAIIQNNRAIVQKYDALTQSLFLDMFGDPVKNEKGWEKVKGSLIYQVKGRVGWKGYKKTDLRESGAYVIGATHIDKFGYINLTNPVYISDEKFLESPEIIIEKNDLIFVQRGNTIGKIGLVRDVLERATINPVVVILRPKVSPYFLLYLLLNKSILNKIIEINSGSAQPMITQNSMNEYQFINPPLELQNLFAERVAVIEAQKQQAQLELAKSEELFTSLLQRAFKGELN